MALALKKTRYRWSPQEVMAPAMATGENGHFKGAFLFEWGPLAGRRVNFEAEACPNPSCECDYLTLNRASKLVGPFRHDGLEQMMIEEQPDLVSPAQ